MGTYRTPSAERLIDSLHVQEAMFRDRAAREANDFAKGLYTGYADSAALIRKTAEAMLPQIEAEAFFGDDEPQMAGDYRDFPAEMVA